jgi:hypothetical protein
MAESEASGAGTEFTDVRPEGPEALDALPDDDKCDIGGDSGDHDNGNDDGSGCGATPYGVTLIRLAYEPLSHTWSVIHWIHFSPTSLTSHIPLHLPPPSFSLTYYISSHFIRTVAQWQT